MALRRWFSLYKPLIKLEKYGLFEGEKWPTRSENWVESEDPQKRLIKIWKKLIEESNDQYLFLKDSIGGTVLVMLSHGFTLFLTNLICTSFNSTYWSITPPYLSFYLETLNFVRQFAPLFQMDINFFLVSRKKCFLIVNICPVIPLRTSSIFL